MSQPSTTSPTDQPAPDWATSICGSRECGKPIIWARTERGSRTPVDAAPSPDGRWLLADVGLAEPVTRFVKEADRAAFAGRLHRSHWASCPKAGSFRNRRPA